MVYSFLYYLDITPKKIFINPYPFSYNAQIDTEIDPIVPELYSKDVKFENITKLPPGLILDNKTGKIYGKPTHCIENYELIISVSNDYESVSFFIMYTCKNNNEDNNNSKLWIPKSINNNHHFIFNANQKIYFNLPYIDDNIKVCINPQLPTPLKFNKQDNSIEGIIATHMPKTRYNILNGDNNSELFYFFIEVLGVPNIKYEKNEYNIEIGKDYDIIPQITGGGEYLIGCDKALPNGLNINTYTGVISGNSNYYKWEDEYTITIQSFGGICKCNLLISVGKGPECFEYTPNEVYIQRCKEYTIIPKVVGHLCSFKIVEGTLPEGCELNEYCGYITCFSPIITKQSKYTVKIECKNKFGSINTDLTIILYGNMSSIVTYPEKEYNLVIDKEIKPIIPNINPDIKYKFKCSSKNLPKGLTLNEENGIISGIPTEKVMFNKVKLIDKKDIYCRIIPTDELNPNGLLVLIEYQEELCKPSFLSLYFRIDAPPRKFQYYSDPKKVIRIRRYNKISINPTYDDNNCTFEIINGSLPSGIELGEYNGILYGCTNDINHNYKATIRCNNIFGYIDLPIEIKLCIISIYYR